VGVSSFRRTNSDGSIAFSRFLPREFKELQNHAGDLAFRSPMSRHEAGKLARKDSKRVVEMRASGGIYTVHMVVEWWGTSICMATAEVMTEFPVCIGAIGEVEKGIPFLMSIATPP